MTPILKDMLKAAREQRKIQEELAELEAQLGEATDRPWSVDNLILCDMLGFPADAAERILAGEPVLEVVAAYQEPVHAGEEPE